MAAAASADVAAGAIFEPLIPVFSIVPVLVAVVEAVADPVAPFSRFGAVDKGCVLVDTDPELVVAASVFEGVIFLEQPHTITIKLAIHNIFFITVCFKNDKYRIFREPKSPAAQELC